MFESELTWFNFNEDGEIVLISVLDNTFIQDVRQKSYDNTGEVPASSVEVKILTETLIPTYVKPKAFADLEDKLGYITFNVGDVIVKGEITEPISVTFDELQEKYDGVYKVVSVKLFDKGSKSMNHWSIKGV